MGWFKCLFLNKCSKNSYEPNQEKPTNTDNSLRNSIIIILVLLILLVASFWCFRKNKKR